MQGDGRALGGKKVNRTRKIERVREEGERERDKKNNLERDGIGKKERQLKDWEIKRQTDRELREIIGTA